MTALGRRNPTGADGASGDQTDNVMFRVEQGRARGRRTDKEDPVIGRPLHGPAGRQTLGAQVRLKGQR